MNYFQVNYNEINLEKMSNFSHVNPETLIFPRHKIYIKYISKHEGIREL